MSARTGELFEESGHVVHLRRFAAVSECTMPQSEEPCSRAECRYHLGNRRPGEHHLQPTRDCALAVANEGPHTLEATARISGLTREWVRQLEGKALAKLARSAELRAVNPDLPHVRRTAFALARALADERGVPIRIAFDDSLRGSRARLRLSARLRRKFPAMLRPAVDELIRELFTP